MAVLLTFWQPHGLFSAGVTVLNGALIVLLTSRSVHPWAHGIALIGWALIGAITISGLFTLALILCCPRRVVVKPKRLTKPLLLGVWLAIGLDGGWTIALFSGTFMSSWWPWLTFVPATSLYLGILYAASLVGVTRVNVWRAHQADTLIVLGAGLLHGDHIGRVLGARLDTALALAKRQSHPVTILVSGGQGRHETMSEAAAMARYLIDHGWAAEQIVQEPAATNTLTNLINSQKLWAQLPQHGGRLVLVTSSYHLFRAQMLAQQLGLHLGGCPAPTHLSYYPIGWAREFLAIVTLHPRLHRGVAVSLLVANWLWLLF